jgi:hypothetical protein
MLLAIWEPDSVTPVVSDVRATGIITFEGAILFLYSVDIALYTFANYGEAFFRKRKGKRQKTNASISLHAMKYSVQGGNNGKREEWVLKYFNIGDLLLTAVLWTDFLYFATHWRSPTSHTRWLRIFRPMKVFFCCKSMHHMVLALAKNYSIFDVLLLITVSLAFFGVIGVQIFSGLYERVDPDTGEHINSNFDSLGESMLSLFVAMTVSVLCQQYYVCEFLCTVFCCVCSIYSHYLVSVHDDRRTITPRLSSTRTTEVS